MNRPTRARSSGSASVMSSPSKRIWPSVTSRFGWPMITLASVDLPEPLGPISAWISPARTVRSTPLRICLSPAWTWRFRISSSAMVHSVFVVSQATAACCGRDGLGWRAGRRTRRARRASCCSERLDDAALHARPQQLGRAAVAAVGLVRAQHAAVVAASSTKQSIGATAPSSASTTSSIVISSAGARQQVAAVRAAGGSRRGRPSSAARRSARGRRAAGSRPRRSPSARPGVRRRLAPELDQQPHAVLRLRREDHRPNPTSAVGVAGAGAERDDVHGSDSRTAAGAEPRRAGASGRLTAPMPVRRSLVPLLAALAAATVTLGGGPAPAATPPDTNPCNDAVLELRCPDLRMAPPGDLRVRKAGKVVRLLATNRIVNDGQGPLELRAAHAGNPGRRLPVREATQVIRNRRGAPVFFPDGGLGVLEGDPRPGALLEVLAGGALRAVDAEPRRLARPMTDRPEALLLLPRPPPRGSYARSPAPDLPRVQPDARPQGAAPRRLARLGRHLPVDLPRELDQRDRTARLLRVRAPRRSARRPRRGARGQQHRRAHDPAAAAPWPRRAARLPARR